MSDEFMDKETRSLLFGAAVGTLFGLIVASFVVAFREKSGINDSDAMLAEQRKPRVEAGTTIMPGCPDTVLVVLYKGKTMVHHSQRNIAEGFELGGLKGSRWFIKVKK
jgi:hypothetical protein